MAAGNEPLFKKFCAAIGRPELADDVRFSTNDRRVESVEALKREIEAALGEAPTDAWLAILEGEGIPCGPINDVSRAIAQPQVRARNMVVTSDDPVAGRMTMAGNPVKTSAFADPAEVAPAPDLDEHREAILRILDE